MMWNIAVTAELVDGSVISLRRLEPSDGDEVVRLYETLTDDERYFRFFTMRPAHLQDLARSITERRNDQYSPRRIRFRKAARRRQLRCMQGRLAAPRWRSSSHTMSTCVAWGPRSLRRLGEIAKENGLHHLVAEVLAENYLMLRVMTDAGWPCTRHLDGSVLHVEIDLNAVNAAAAELAER